MDVKHQQRLGPKKIEDLPLDPLDPLVRKFGCKTSENRLAEWSSTEATNERWTATILGCSAPSEREPMM